MSYALWLLGRRAYTEAELRQRLLRRALPDAECDRVVGRLRELRLLDDRAYAEAYLRNRAAERGRYVLQQELRRKGIDESLIKEVMAGDENMPPLDEAQQQAAARDLLRKHAWRFGPGGVTGNPAGDPAHVDQAQGDPEDDARVAQAARRKALARASAFLARRGFAPDAVAVAIDEVLGELSSRR